jgi:hypothetical protein
MKAQNSIKLLRLHHLKWQIESFDSQNLIPVLSYLMVLHYNLTVPVIQRPRYLQNLYLPHLRTLYRLGQKMIPFVLPELSLIHI